MIKFAYKKHHLSNYFSLSVFNTWFSFSSDQHNYNNINSALSVVFKIAFVVFQCCKYMLVRVTFHSIINSEMFCKQLWFFVSFSFCTRIHSFVYITPRHWNTGLVSSGVSLTSVLPLWPWLATLPVIVPQ